MLKFLTMPLRSCSGMNGAPFLRLSHESEFIPTTNKSPNFLADLKYSI